MSNFFTISGVYVRKPIGMSSKDDGRVGSWQPMIGGLCTQRPMESPR